MQRIYIKKQMPENDWNNIKHTHHTKYLFFNNGVLVAVSNFKSELIKYAKENGQKHFTIVLNDKSQTNILY